jgi:hypothetical protein
MALPKHKTCLSILRSILGPGAGNEARFAKKIARSASWLKKASCGQIPLSRDAALSITYATGVSMKWLLDADISKPAVQTDGSPFTLESYSKHIEKMRDGFDEEDASISRDEFVGCLHEAVSIYLEARKKNLGGLFTFKLEEALIPLRKIYGKANIHQSKQAHGIVETLGRVVKDWDHTRPTIYVRKSPAPTPPKKQPSRKSASKVKRP